MTTILENTSRAQDRRPRPDRTAALEAAQHDAELVRRFCCGDEAAFLEIMARYRHALYALTAGFLRSHADAEEITQDTFVRAHRGLRAFRGDSSLSTWLHSIALNLARNRYWYNFRRRRHATISLDCPLTDGATTGLADLAATEDADPARIAVASEFTSLVAACMSQLPPAHREILKLRNVRNLSYEEIGGALGISVGTVKSRIARARRSIRALLSEMCPEFARDAGLGEWFEPVRSSGRLAVA